jgi:hypothetical protein
MPWVKSIDHPVIRITSEALTAWTQLLQNYSRPTTFDTFWCSVTIGPWTPEDRRENLQLSPLFNVSLVKLIKCKIETAQA